MFFCGLNSAIVEGLIGLSIAVASEAEKIMTKCLALLPVSPELKGTINQLHIFKKLLPSQVQAINDSYRSGQN